MSGIQQGAAVGSAILPGWGTAIGAVAGGLLDGFGGGGAASAPSSAANWTDQVFDNSGWVVSTGSSKATAEAAAPADVQSLQPWVILGVVAMLVVGWVRTR